MSWFGVFQWTASEPRPQINDKIDVKMVRKKITGFYQKRVQFGDFFPENVICLPFSFSSLGPNASEKRSIESAEKGQNDKPIIKFLSQNHDAVVG